jgi:predicted nuclease of predicted toxin-antitoxin system
VKLLVDVNLSPAWVGFLGEHQIEAVHWSDVGDPRAEDTVLVEWARRHGHLLFTHDLDFSRIVALSHEDGPSIVQVRTEDVLPSAIGELVVRTLRDHSEILQAGAIVVLDRSTARARILPL